MSGGYADFWQATGDALSFAATALKLDLPPGKRASLRDGYRKPGCWPDVTAALRSLKSAGIRLAFLSNMTAELLESGIRNSALDGMFDHVVSTDRVARRSSSH